MRLGLAPVVCLVMMAAEIALGRQTPWPAVGLIGSLAAWVVMRFLDTRAAGLANQVALAQLGSDLDAIREKLTLVDNRTQPRIAR